MDTLTIDANCFYGGFYAGPWARTT